MNIQEERIKRQREFLDTIKKIVLISNFIFMFLWELIALLSDRIKSFCGHFSFWVLPLILLPASAQIIYLLAYIFVSPQNTLSNGTQESISIGIGELLSSPENARYILSSISQIQASIFGIFFTLSFLIFQIQIQNRSASPYSMKQTLKSKRFLLIAFIFILSILLDIISINALSGSKFNIFWPLTIFLFSILMLFAYAIASLLDLSQREILEEVQTGKERVNLDGANLERIDLRGRNFDDRTLSRANLYGSNLQKTSFIGANLSATDLRWSNLNEAFLSRANLSYSKLVGANLTGATLDGADLNKADLTWAFCRKDKSKWGISWGFYYIIYNMFLRVAKNLKDEENINSIPRQNRLKVIHTIIKNYNDFYDETTLIELFKSKNLINSILDDILLDALIEKAKDLQLRTDIDEKLKESIQLFLSSKDTDKGI